MEGNKMKKKASKGKKKQPFAPQQIRKKERKMLSKIKHIIHFTKCKQLISYIKGRDSI